MSRSPGEACEQLFRRYPLAVDPGGDGENCGSMALLVPGAKPSFYLLDCPRPGRYALFRWDEQLPFADAIGADDAVPQEGRNVLARAVPMPRAGALFGWTDRGEVTALIQVALHDDGSDPDFPGPCYSVMPMAGTAESRWPPQTGRAFGSWFWDNHAGGRVIDLAPAAGRTRGQVWWCPVSASGAGKGVIVVESPVAAEEFTWPAGVYAYYRRIRSGTVVPSPEEALASPGKLDLGPRF